MPSDVIQFQYANTVELYVGDCLDVLRTLPADHFQTCVTSPPYLGLRDYQVAGQIGREQTPDEYVAQLVAVFQEVRRVLRDDGTLWLNLGDSYANDSKWGGSSGGKHAAALHGNTGIGRTKKHTGAKDKDLLMIPARVALALQADGWWLRSDIIWQKINPMPSPAKDRPTSSHEHVFLLTKQPRYFFDAEAVAEPSCAGDQRPQTKRAREIAEAGGLTPDHFAALRACGLGDAGKDQMTQTGFGHNRADIQALADEAKAVLGGYTREFLINDTRNIRDVWTIATKPFKGSHFAVMAPEVARRCILAGCPVGGTVLDPFGGAGTTGMVAAELGRRATLIELNPDYAAIARERLGHFIGKSLSKHS